MSNNLNPFGNYSLNGIPYQSPPGFTDRIFDYVFPDPQQFASGEVVLAAGQTVEFDEFTDQGSIFVWFGLEIPPPAITGGPAGGYKLAVQIFIGEEAVFTDALNNAAAFGNQSQPLPIFPARYLAPGTLVRVVATNYDNVDYYNFALVLRGMRRYVGATS